MSAALEKVTQVAIVANGAVFVWSLVDPSAELAEHIEQAITALFVAEMVWRWRAAGWKLGHFHGWHLFDALVIALALLPMLPGTTVLRLARLAKAMHLAHAAQLRIIQLRRPLTEAA